MAHNGDRFLDELRTLSTPQLGEYFDAIGVLPGEGCYAEVNIDASDWMQHVASSLTRGYVLTFDYGYEASDLYAPWRKRGTMLAFYRHTSGDDPYARVGRQDITASVDFTTVKRAGEERERDDDGQKARNDENAETRKDKETLAVLDQDISALEALGRPNDGRHHAGGDQERRQALSKEVFVETAQGLNSCPTRGLGLPHRPATRKPSAP